MSETDSILGSERRGGRGASTRERKIVTFQEQETSDEEKQTALGIKKDAKKKKSTKKSTTTPPRSSSFSSPPSSLSCPKISASSTTATAGTTTTTATSAVGPVVTTTSTSTSAELVEMDFDAPEFKRLRAISPPSTPRYPFQPCIDFSRKVYGSVDSTGSEPFILYREDITHSSVNDGMDLMPISLERDGSFGMDDMLNGEDLTLEANDFLPIEVPPPVPARVPGQVLLKQKVTKGAKDKKKRVLYVDAATQVEEDSAVGEIPFACVEAVGFKHPELRHELSILSWLSSQVTNPEFEIGVPILAADEASASFNKRVYSTASDKRARDFLTTTVLIDAGSRQDTPNPGNSMYSLSPPSLEHQSSALAFSIENDWVFNEYAPNGVGGVDGGV